jgi:FixJ family two-component response regulator
MRRQNPGIAKEVRMHAHVATVHDQRRNPSIAKSIALDTVIDVRPAVFVIDDDVSVRESLELLMRTTGWEFHGFASAEHFLAYPRPSVPCCVIVDLMLPGVSGLELQKQLGGDLDVPMIFMSGHADIVMTVQAMKAGAIEFLTKPLRTDLLVKATHDAIERSRATLRLHSEMRGLTSRYGLLTPREREVMALVVAGLLNKQVGFELGISEVTVKAHRGQVMRKMRAESLPALVTMATRLGPQHSAEHRTGNTFVQ